MSPIAAGTGARARPAASRGTGLLDLLTGLAVGLGVLAAAAVLLGGPLQEQRRLLAALRQHQDLDAALATAHGELRRAGATTTGDVDPGLWLDLPAPGPLPTGATLPEPLVLEAAWSPRPRVSWSAPLPGSPGTPGDHGGWRLDGRTLSWRTTGTVAAPAGGDTWQPQTDPALAPVAGLSVGQRRTGLGLLAHCPRTACPAAAPGAAPCGPWWWRRALHLSLDPAPRPDLPAPARLGHHLSLRHDWIQGVCPD
jgi:type IV pilus assembly protein PilW